ncbi:outer membrane receptor for ferrienterochelin and colicins [Pustulibacterium marinum]|uniref:Outer membrane receptor for ferrienterochelin and colicins n=1 Tax=Pustulibacterium marinum TaxID=1224947 RepID=A0A1I7F810_9FLAO|nr:TonB-dependent receptor plug domain-containing protein [Pustulibacterium marinum]SFU32275.1 outer membrane receptor for ferrienterochelin and colicins [Pustulibacterium marinum]
MNSCKRNKFILLFLLFGIQLNAQQNDSIPKEKHEDLEEVVVTGQYNAQSVDKSVFEVRVINRREIDQLAGNNLADILNQTLNINIIPNASTGKSGVQLFGLDAQYFKILVDNIPLINDEGLGNNTDLTQINLDDIERIEIVEGSMGVQYGANAVSGIINIITKKSSVHKWQVSPYVQEETIGDEYNWVDKGRHIQSIKLGHNFNESLYGNAIFTRNNFNGFWGDKEGKSYLYNDGLRGYEWLPKEQYTVKSLWSYKKKNFNLFYKFEFFDEQTERYAEEVRENYMPETETTQPVASDEVFSSARFFHHLNANGQVFKQVHYDVSLSYQEQKRNVEAYNYRIRTEEKFDVEDYEYESRKAYYSRGNFSNFLPKKQSDIQIGYEVNSIKGFASSVSGMYSSENIERTLGSYDVFASSEIVLSDKVSLRPGARALFSSNFNTQAAVSLSARYALKNGWELRGILGTSPRLPSYEELYTYFVDVNHDVRGNSNLNPEQGTSAFIHLKKKSKINDWYLSNKLSGWFMNVKDRIELVIINQSPLQYEYTNIDTYNAWGLTFTNTANINNVRINGGATFLGVSKVLESEESDTDDYLYGIQLNVNASYQIPKWNTVVSAYLKYNGPQYQYVQEQDENGEIAILKGKQSDYSWLSATVRKSFLDNKLQATLGARNIFDVTTLRNTTEGGTVHSAGSTNNLLGYGRSYFLKLLYNFNF